MEVALSVLAGLALVGAGFVVLAPSVFSSAFALILCVLGIAGLWLLLAADLLAALEILVYAGAVMVLFLFVVMLVGDEGSRKGSVWKSACGVLLLLVAWGCIGEWINWDNILLRDNSVETEWGNVGLGLPYDGSAKAFGYALFGKYVYVLQWMGLLLLLGIIGVVQIGQLPIGGQLGREYGK